MAASTWYDIGTLTIKSISANIGRVVSYIWNTLKSLGQSIISGIFGSSKEMKSIDPNDGGQDAEWKDFKVKHLFLFELCSTFIFLSNVKKSVSNCPPVTSSGPVANIYREHYPTPPDFPQ